MQVKSCPAKVKVAEASENAPEGQFTALVSVFSTVDSVKDIVMPGAFTKSLASYAEKGSPIPVVWSHDWDDPFSHIGYTTSAQETEAGLEVTGQLDLDNPKAAQVYRLLKGGRIKDFSFAYDVKDAAGATKDGQDITELRELDVFEVGPTLVGAHRGTELLDIKAKPRKFAIAVDRATRAAIREIEQLEKAIGRAENLPDDLKPGTDVDVYAYVSSAELSDLIKAQVHEAVKDALSRSQDEVTRTDGKATPAQPAAAEEPAGAKADEPARQGTASARLCTDLELFEFEASTYE